MHIDWFVFFAQIVNFLILVFLLKRFLYGRIVKAMDNRESMIIKRFEEAENLKKEAEKSAALFEEKNRTLAQKQEELLNQMVQAAEHQKKELLEKARQDVDAIRERWRETIIMEKNSFLQDLRQRAGKQIYSITRRILDDMADADLEERIVRVFIKRLENMDDVQREALSDSVVKGSGIIIQSAFPLSEHLQTAIRDALERQTGGLPYIQYEVSSEIISGIELRAHGHKLAWSLNDHLENLEEVFARTLMEETKAKA